MVNYRDTEDLQSVYLCLRRGGGVYREAVWANIGKPRDLSDLMLFAICLSVITLKARSIERRRSQSATPPPPSPNGA